MSKVLTGGARHGLTHHGREQIVLCVPYNVFNVTMFLTSWRLVLCVCMRVRKRVCKMAICISNVNDVCMCGG